MFQSPVSLAQRESDVAAVAPTAEREPRERERFEQACDRQRTSLEGVTAQLGCEIGHGAVCAFIVAADVHRGLIQPKCRVQGEACPEAPPTLLVPIIAICLAYSPLLGRGRSGAANSWNSERMADIRSKWQRLSSRVAYCNAWLTVREDQVIRPDGQPGIYGVIELKVGLGIVALDENDEVWLLGQYRYPIDAPSWEIVNGTVEDGEEPVESAKRELVEEAGLVASEWTSLGRFHPSCGMTDELALLYLATGLTAVEAEPEATEEFVPRRVPLGEALAMMERGEITDSYSVIGLLLTERHLLRQFAGHAST